MYVHLILWKHSLIQPVKYVPHFIVDIRNGHCRISQRKPYKDSSEVESQDSLEFPSKARGRDREHFVSVLLLRYFYPLQLPYWTELYSPVLMTDHVSLDTSLHTKGKYTVGIMIFVNVKRQPVLRQSREESSGTREKGISLGTICLIICRYI